MNGKYENMKTMITHFLNCRTILLFVMVMILAAVPAMAFQAAPAVPESTSERGAHHSASQVDSPSKQLAADAEQGVPSATATEKIVDALISPPVKNDHIFNIGPHLDGQDHDRTTKRSRDRQPAEGIPHLDPNAPAAGHTPNKEVHEASLKEEKWIQMDLDQNGTYLFFGESTETDETQNGTDTSTWPDYGVGIGQKWHF